MSIMLGELPTNKPARQHYSYHNRVTMPLPIAEEHCRINNKGEEEGWTYEVEEIDTGVSMRGAIRIYDEDGYFLGYI